MKHIERHHSKHVPDQIFDLVADVERYPKFLPWVVAARVYRRKDNIVWVELTMGTGLFNKRFTTVAKLDRPHRIEISSRDPIFERYEQIWTFAGNGEGGTDIHCEVDLEFGSRVMQLLISPSVGERTKAMVQAYIREAQRLYPKR